MPTPHSRFLPPYAVVCHFASGQASSCEGAQPVAGVTCGHLTQCDRGLAGELLEAFDPASRAPVACFIILLRARAIADCVSIRFPCCFRASRVATVAQVCGCAEVLREDAVVEKAASTLAHVGPKEVSPWVCEPVIARGASKLTDHGYGPFGLISRGSSRRGRIVVNIYDLHTRCCSCWGQKGSLLVINIGQVGGQGRRGHRERLARGGSRRRFLCVLCCLFSFRWVPLEVVHMFRGPLLLPQKSLPEVVREPNWLASEVLRRVARMCRVEPSEGTFVALISSWCGRVLRARFVVSLQSLRKTVAIISCAEMIFSAAIL